MDYNEKKCSCHSETNAMSYCEQCRIFMCNKCLNYHKELFKNHQELNLDKDGDEIFIDICSENGHDNKYEFYCKNHNVLCCACCITKIEDKNFGKHKDCDVCFIDNIKEEKKNKLIENIKQLENLSNNFEQLLNESKINFKKIKDKKEELKLKVQNIFTKIRTDLNAREDELLSEIDKKYNDNFFIKIYQRY